MADSRAYWLDLFTWGTWTEFAEAGAEVSGFRLPRLKTLARMKAGDYLLCYLTGISRFLAVLEVVSDAYVDETPIWKAEPFPARIKVKVVAKLDPETAVPVVDLLPKFSWFPALKSPEAWTGYFRGSPVQMAPKDGEMVTAAILEATATPQKTPFDPRKLKRRTYKPKSKAGTSTSVDPSPPVDLGLAAEPATQAAEPVDISPVPPDQEPEEVAKKAPAHREMQWLLGKLGNELGLTVWLPPSDRGLEYQGHRLGDLTLGELPLMFSQKALRTVRQIDVIWLGDGSIEAAFEIESTTSIYSGILRMADLIALVPGITIPLYIVAPDERRKKVYAEITRPVFGRLAPPMVKSCRYIPFSAIRTKLPPPEMRAYTSPHFIKALSEEGIPDITA
jgi:hypothetical protein